MSISCSCDTDDVDWMWQHAEDFSIMPKRKRRKRCYSCKKFLNEGDTVLELFRISWDEHGDERELASIFMCEECGEILLNLTAAGLCIWLDGDLRKDLETYHEMTGFDAKKYKEAGE